VRIKELADLTGSTVRTVRYYHQIGLLPVPARRDGRRDYDVTHVARLVRVRWLAQAGIPLVTIAAMVGEDAAGSAGAGEPTRAAVLGDLHATVATLDAQLAELQRQRERVQRLVAALERDGHLSPMPAAMVRFYDTMQARAADETARRFVRRERDFMELAFYRGDMPPESAAVYEGFTEARLAESSALFGEIAARVPRGDPPDDAEIERIVGAVIDRMTRHLGTDLDRFLRSVDLAVAGRAVDLYVRLAEPHERRLAAAIGAAVLAIIEKGQQP
jgi:DNA-binding transcriptional MerR regulator